MTKTYQQLINNAIRKLVVIITLSISALILVVVGVQQYVQTVRETNGQMMSLSRANIDDIRKENQAVSQVLFTGIIRIIVITDRIRSFELKPIKLRSQLPLVVVAKKL